MKSTGREIERETPTLMCQDGDPIDIVWGDALPQKCQSRDDPLLSSLIQANKSVWSVLQFNHVSALRVIMVMCC